MKMETLIFLREIKAKITEEFLLLAGFKSVFITEATFKAFFLFYLYY